MREWKEQVWIGDRRARTRYPSRFKQGLREAQQGTSANLRLVNLRESQPYRDC